MWSVWSYMFLGITFLISSTYARSTNGSSEPMKWDIITFSQSWPITGCKEWIDKQSSHECSLPQPKDSWIVHGAWPDLTGSKHPVQFCNKTWHFDPEAVKTIETELIEHWTNIETGTSKYEFWAHEWNKHGTCAAALPALNSEYKYFSQGLAWNRQYNMTTVLQAAGITPDDHKQYSVEDIHHAIKASTGAEPVIQCYRKAGLNYLVELRVCFDTKLQLTPCVSGKKVFGGVTVKTNCVSSGIIYPKNVPMEMFDLWDLDVNVEEQSWTPSPYEVIRV